MNGAAGRRVYGFSSTDRTANVAPSRLVRETARTVLVECQHLLALQPAVVGEVAALRDPLAVDGMSRASKLPGSNVPAMSQYEAETNSMRSRSRSTTSRVATDCTRPADRRGITFFQSTGETS